ncbi:MAG: 4-hydroxythreonine-4-phosphate dehydrogenase PdxA [Bacteroidetes bacterium]|nr:4-hydroxythreonine-4-phosphate dehydrogenase PdxA [Bacteroidota bacterium]MBV6461427.1 4-hydroxythreonine-4-phosphate dehydrogenase [Flavobacteriales bacterium]WKZ76575.1 MAG: 4-hydroxythreonine-4-phosphate dehydrogenase PdxA [Vicingaceae bacterium]MCL4815604.1 4-hydroxythreonine-4-phosphate dehydrogenase PdxA [Flavobacteriales bacterium]NOG94258.1 4-hydroxythreonine-4-phosphate dehydrogenase PdxA [Bacteroidota bacterium]
MSEKIKIGITSGDINGIGTEIIIKTLNDNLITDLCTPIYYGSSKVVSFYKKTLDLPDFNFNKIRSADEANPKKNNLINIWDEELSIEPGKSNNTFGKYAYYSLKTATDDLLQGKIQALVTAPIDKKNIQSNEFNFPGHTEYLAHRAEGNALMILSSEEMRVALVTGHIPLSEVSKKITKEAVIEKIKKLNQSLITDFSIRKPRIAVLGLNPHAGDNDLIGKEDKEMILPAIETSKSQGILAFGPFPADGFFGNMLHKKYDAVLAMYHDQGLSPFKLSSFGNGINYTAGLKIIRTSPDHGTAFDIAGKNKANENSFRQAIYTAIEIYKNRTTNSQLVSNPLPFAKTGDKDN